MNLDSIVIFPGNAVITRVTSSGSQEIPIREAYVLDRFGIELGKRACVEVRVEDGQELPQPQEGVIFISFPEIVQRAVDREGEQFRSLAPRIVLLDIARTYALEWAEKLTLAAVIDTIQYFQWQDGQNSDHSSAFFGLKQVGRALGASWPEYHRVCGPNYALLSHPDFFELPDLLAAYLDTYTKFL